MSYKIREYVHVDVTNPEMAGVYGWFVRNGRDAEECALVGKAISGSVENRLKDYLDKDWFVDVRKNASTESGPVFAEFVIKCLARLCTEHRARLFVRRIDQPMEVMTRNPQAKARSMIAELEAWLKYSPILQTEPVKLSKRYRLPKGRKWRFDERKEAELEIRSILKADFTI